MLTFTVIGCQGVTSVGYVLCLPSGVLLTIFFLQFFIRIEDLPLYKRDLVYKLKLFREDLHALQPPVCRFQFFC